MSSSPHRNAHPSVKLSSPATKEFWEIPVLFDDEHLLALDKPPCVLTSPDRDDRQRPSLMGLMHQDIERRASWALQRGISYLFNAYRLDFETSGVLLFAKSKPVLIELANQLGSEQAWKRYLTLVPGGPKEDEMIVTEPLAPDLQFPGRVRCSRDGKASKTIFRVLERFRGSSLLECRPIPDRAHQVRMHAKFAGFPIYGDALYSRGRLWLSSLKPDFHLKPDREERPLTPGLALHTANVTILHPVHRSTLSIEAPLPKDLTVALKYLRRYAT